MSKKFYLTTAIAYTSSKPHIGNVYEAILADAIVRYKKKDGFDTYFQTGTDEHGQKIELKAKGLGITPKEHVDNISSQIKEICMMEYYVTIKGLLNIFNKNANYSRYNVKFKKSSN